MANKLKLTRDQLASFLKDAEQIKQFEQLFALADSIAPDVVNEININAGNAQASANDALAQLQRLADIVGLLATEPAQEHNNSVVADYIDTNTLAPTPIGKPGRAYWDDGAGSLVVGLKGGNVTYIDGQQEYALCYNDSGGPLTKGQVVYISGAQGNRIAVKLAQADSDANSAHTIGFVAESIAAGAEGWVHTAGPLYKLNTLGTIAGSTVYLSPTTPGAWTTTKPVAPYHTVIVGFIERVHASVGSIYVKVDNGYELDELHNVKITSVQPNDLLQYDSLGPYWKNVAPSTVSVGTATNLAGGAAGSVPYQSGAGTTTFLSIGAANYVLTSTGTAPTWTANTGTGNVVRAASPTIATPTITTSATVPLVIGGTGTTSTLTLRSTSGVGTTGADIILQTGNNGATEAVRVRNNGTVQTFDSIGLGITPATGNQIYFKNDSGDVNNTFRIDAFANQFYFATNSAAGAAAGTSISFYTGEAGAGGSERLRIESSGNVGIGSASPATKLDVAGGVSAQQVTGRYFGFGTTGFSFDSTTVNNYGITYTEVSSTYNTVLAGYSNIKFTTVQAERMRIDSAGNVGIGTSSPDALLTVNTIASFGDGAVATPSIAHKGDLNTGFWFPAADTIAASTAGSERVRIDSSGNVGIGSASPAYKLDVTGTFNVTGNVILGDATTDTVTVNGYIGQGVAPTSQYGHRILYTGSGSASQYGLYVDLFSDSSGTSNTIAVRARARTSATAYTTSTAADFLADTIALGAGSTITNAIGVYILDQTVGTNNFGVYSSVSSGSNKWNIYASGTANNAFAGNVRVGAVTAPTNALDVTGSMTATVNILGVGTGGVGYGTGSGGAVTQATSRTTGVTLDKTNGAITLVSAAGTATWQSFTVTNNKVAATDTVIVNQKSGTDLYMIHVTNVAAGSFRITFATTGGTTTEQPVFNFAIIKAVTN